MDDLYQLLLILLKFLIMSLRIFSVTTAASTVEGATISKTTATFRPTSNPLTTNSPTTEGWCLNC